MLTVFIILSVISNVISIELAFGSCADFRKYKDNGIFNTIAQFHPDYWIWLGDVAYLGNRISKNVHRYQGKVEAIKRLGLTKNNIGYQRLISSVKGVYGVWDDHDYGMKDGNKDFELKEETKKLFLEFLDEPKDSLRWNADSLFFTKIFNSQSISFKLIMLDGRTHSDGEKDLLGEFQWNLLEKELSDNSVSFFIITSGIQVFPNDRFPHEMWPDYSKKRLYQLLRKRENSLKPVLLLSGDVHMGEILEDPEYHNFYEITSSGLTHNRATTHNYAHFLTAISLPDTYSLSEKRYIGYNFGILKIEGMKIKASIYNEKGELKIFKRIDLSQEIVKSDIELPNIYLRIIFNFIQKMISDYILLTTLLILCCIISIYGLFQLEKKFGKKLQNKSE